ncbi:TIR domain-containing adapter molecule 1 [Hemicordylus capensis]|uniref:TIR domain-containing adapter molecule 1 n=1 Tax=Hemicordylus capensis TaxID=884348 RepID=UPI002302062B|nr:TIR domain-containing adapter molecule 1 [Hemicordylus capensis]
MEESSQAQPSIEGIFRILATIPDEGLVNYKHRLKCSRQDRRSCQLLQAMILLTLKREAEARNHLDALREDVTAAHLCRSRWGNARARNSDPMSPKEEAEVALAMAQMYSLLADEKLCGSLAREEAYRAAIEALQSSNGTQKTKLASLLAEARDKCGLNFTPRAAGNNFGALRSDAGKFPAPASSAPLPIKNPSEPHSLHSISPSGSFASRLEISQSPTVPFLTRSIHRRGIPGSSKQCGMASSQLTPQGEAGGSLESPAESQPESPVDSSMQDKLESKGDGRLQGHDTPGWVVSPNLEESVQHSLECTEPPTTVAEEPQDPKGGMPQNPPTSPIPQTSSAAGECSQKPIGKSNSPAQTTELGPPSPSNSIPAPLSTDSSTLKPQYDEREFFTFVVLHAGEDETLACQVKDRLESLGVSNGATLSEHFLVPGHSQLSCFQNALDNSAFTLLLLTQNFNSRLCRYQVDVALMDSLTRSVKSDSVIPFVPKESPIKKKEMPILLNGLVPLDENSPVFIKRVKNTFTPTVLKQKRVQWSYMREIQERERLLLQQEQHRTYQQMIQHLSTLRLPPQMPFPAPQAHFSGFHHAPAGGIPQPFLPPSFPAPGMPQPGPAQPSLPFAVPLGPPSLMPGAAQPHLIIQNAQMIQIGDYNQMHVERTQAALGMAGEEVGENL